MKSRRTGTGREARVGEARAALLDAVVDPARWDDALKAFADACGGRSGQIIALDSHRQVTSHRLTDAPDGFLREVEAFGLTDPARNPRVRAGLSAGLMTPLADQDYVSADERARLPIYAELFDPMDFSHNCQIVLMRSPDLLVRASVSRTRKQGAFDAESFEAFESLAPYMKAAVGARAALGLAHVQAVLHTLEAVDAAAFVLNERGGVLCASARAAALADKGDLVRLSHGRLRTVSSLANEMLEACLRDPTEAVLPVAAPLPGGVLELRPLPTERDGLGLGPALLAIIRAPRTRDEREASVQETFGLTVAEAAVAVALADGIEIPEIARLRGASLTTVRTQLRAAYLKMGVRRQAELVMLVRGGA